MRHKFKFTTPIALLALTLIGAGCDPSAGGVQNVAPPPEVDTSTAPTADQKAVTPDAMLLRRNFYVVFDGSGSMNEGRCAGNSRKVDVAKKAVIGFERNLKPEDNLGLVVFDNAGVSQRIAIGTNNRKEFEDQVEAIHANHGTPLYESIQYAFERLEEQRQKQLGYGEYHIVVVTDGEANGIAENGLIERINKTPVVVHTVGFCIDSGHSLNQPGKTYYADAKSPEELSKSLKDVLAESEKFGQ